VASWILTPPGKLTAGDRAALAQITARCAELAATRDLVREFADMLCHRRGEHLEAWAGRAEASPVSELRGFSKGLRKDWAAVTAGLTVSYSSGAVEGHVNRIKMIKRQMYGRAKPDLLQARPARRLNPSRQLSQSQFLVAVVNWESKLCRCRRLVVSYRPGEREVMTMGKRSGTARQRRPRGRADGQQNRSHRSVTARPTTTAAFLSRS
jgi:Transposase